MGECKYNMSVHIGRYNQQPVELSLNKEFVLTFQINILPACPVLHKALFQAQAEAEEKVKDLKNSEGQKVQTEYDDEDASLDTADMSISIAASDLDLQKENYDLQKLVENYESKLDK